MIDYQLVALCYDDHDWDIMSMVCKRCGITAEAVAAGRDKPPTWEDVDNAYVDGRNLGIEIGAADYEHRRRRKLIEVGYYLCLRNLSKEFTK